MPLTSAERVRRHREKLKKDPEKFKEQKKKHAALVKSKTKKISELTEAEKEKQREKWRRQKRKQKENKKTITTPSSSASCSQLTSTNTVCKKSDRTKSKKLTLLAKKYKRALQRIQTLNTSLQTTKKKLYRQKKKYENLEKQNATLKAREEILEIALKDLFRKSKTQNEKRILKSLAENTRVKLARKQTYVLGLLGLKGRLRKRKAALKNDNIRKELESFFIRDDISRCTAGKRECRTQKGTKKTEQIRYLTDTLINLYKIYKSEGGKYSLSTFFKYKPFYVLAPCIQNRDTCMCVKHANFELLLNALHRNKLLQDCKTVSDIIKKVTCNEKSLECMTNECKKCMELKLDLNLAQEQVDLDVHWIQWERVDHKYKKAGTNECVVTKKSAKVQKNGKIKELIKEFENAIPKFKTHYYTWKHQQKQYQELIKSLNKNEALIICDFSENYGCKLANEIQSMHFGASKQQITLHTGMVYWDNECQSFCSVADNPCHEPAAIWAHLMPVIKMIKEIRPETNIVHFYSDGPSSQYRQKKNFFLHNLFTKQFNLDHSTWSFTESGHGKGVADGIGGTSKRTLDRNVVYGNDVTDASQAHEILTKCLNSVECFYIQDCDIENIQKLIPKELSVLPGTMKIHQISSTGRDEIKHRTHSCFCGPKKGLCDCFTPKQHKYQKNTKTNKITKGHSSTVKSSKPRIHSTTSNLPIADINSNSIKPTNENQSKCDTLHSNSDRSDFVETFEIRTFTADIHHTSTNPYKSKGDIHPTGTNFNAEIDPKNTNDIHSITTTNSAKTSIPKHDSRNFDIIEIFDEDFNSMLTHSNLDSINNLNEILEIDDTDIVKSDENLNRTSHVSPEIEFVDQEIDDKVIVESDENLNRTSNVSPEIEFVDQFDIDSECSDHDPLKSPLSHSDESQLSEILQNIENVVFDSDPLTLREEPKIKLKSRDLINSWKTTPNKKRNSSDIHKICPTVTKMRRQMKTENLLKKPSAKENIKLERSKGLKTIITRTLQCASCNINLPFRTTMAKCMACKKNICLKCSDGCTDFDYICDRCFGDE